MGDTTKIGMQVEITLCTGFYYSGEVLEETEHNIVIRDLKEDRLELAKSAIIAMRVIGQ